MLQLSPLLRSLLEQSEDIMSETLSWMYWNNGETAWFYIIFFVSAWIHSGCCWWQSFHDLGIGILNFCNLWLILILKHSFKFSSSMGKQSSGMSEQIVLEYGIAVIVWESIGDENHWVIVLFLRWYISFKDG